MNNFQPLPAFTLIFVAIIIPVCDRADFGVSHVKDVVWNFIGFIGLVLILA